MTHRPALPLLLTVTETAMLLRTTPEVVYAKVERGALRRRRHTDTDVLFAAGIKMQPFCGDLGR